MNRKTIDAYVAFWAIGLGFLWWPFVLARTLLERRPAGRRPVLLLITTGCLVLSFFLAVIRGADPSRLIAATANLSIWLSLCFILARSWTRKDATEVIRGVVDVAVIQGVLALVARLIYPVFSGTTLPAARFLPESLANEDIVHFYSTVLLAAPGYYGRAVTRTGGLFGVSTWAGALAALGVLLLVFAGSHLGPWMRRPVVQGAGVLVCLLTLFWSYSRMDVIALVVGALAVLTIKARRALQPRLWLATMFLGVGGMLAVLPAVPFSVWFEEVNAPREGSLVTRSEIYYATLGEVTESPTPLVGEGIKERSEDLVASRGTHSTYLGLSYRGGLLCSIAFVLFLLGLGYRAIHANAELAVGLVCFTLVWCFTDDIDVGNFVPLALVIAYGLTAGDAPEMTTDELETARVSPSPA